MNSKYFQFLLNILYLILPKTLFDYFAYLNGCRFFKISYSQYGEDLILMKYLKNKKIKKGKYLDIGAFHPRWISNTHLLHKNGFSGFVVDIDEDRLKWFKFSRGNKVKTFCGAVSNKFGKNINVYKFKNKNPFSLIDTTSFKFAKRQSLKGVTKRKFEIKKIKNYHINEIFRSVGKINVLNIDIEGKDFEVLKSSNLKIINPEIILIEDHSSYFPSHKLITFFKKRKYHLISICGLTKCFAKK